MKGFVDHKDFGIVRSAAFGVRERSGGCNVVTIINGLVLC